MIIKSPSSKAYPGALRKEQFMIAAMKMRYEKSARQKISLETYPKNKPRHDRKKSIARLKRLGYRQRNNVASLYSKKLSPGCVYCTKGNGLTVSFSDKCNRTCFYCYQYRPQKNKSHVKTLHSVTQKIMRLHSQAPLKSFAITGGEPLLHARNVCRALSYAKKHAGDECQTRLYTNGDFITSDMLMRLSDSGLDEIRFGLNDYDINYRKIAMAQRYVTRVMIEFPVMPGHKKQAKSILRRANNLGLFGVNIKEMNYTGKNTEIFRRKNFFLKSRTLNPIQFAECTFLPLYAVYGSEELCFELMDYAAGEKFTIGIHYCSINNKKLSYAATLRAVSRRDLKPYELVARNGLVKVLAIYDAEMEKAEQILTRHGVPPRERTFVMEKNRIVIHSKHLPLFRKKGLHPVFLYYRSTADGKILNMRRAS